MKFTDHGRIHRKPPEVRVRVFSALLLQVLITNNDANKSLDQCYPSVAEGSAAV